MPTTGLLAALALATRALAAPTAEVIVDPQPVHVGDRVAVEIVLHAADLAGEPRFPAWGDAWGDADVVTAAAVEAVPGGYRQRLLVAPFATGDVTLPPQAIGVPTAGGTTRVETPAAVVHVASLLPAAEAKPEARPAAPPEALPLGRRFWWTAAIGSALCLLAGTLLYLRPRTATAASAARTVPGLPPLAELEQELDALAGLGGALAGEPAHTRMSLAARRFLGRVFGFPALESSTSEIRTALRRQAVPHAASAAVLDALRACDAVKFARQDASLEAATERLRGLRAAARTISETMAPAPPATETPA